MYFDNNQKQYQQANIVNPPVYTQLEVAKVIEKIVSKKEVVDFGAGTGRLTIPLLKNGCEVTAVDVSSVSLDKLKKLAKKIGLNKLKTNTEINKADTIVGCDVLHHVNISKYFKEFYRNLTSGGRIVFSEPNGFNFFWYLLVWLKLDWNEEKGIRDINFFNVRQKLVKAGFKNIKIEGLGLLPGPIGINKTICRVNYWLGSLPLIKLLAYRLIISASKE